MSLSLIHLEEHRFEITISTPPDEFLSVMNRDNRTASVSAQDLLTIFNRLRDKVVRQDQEDKHKLERRERHLIDALRSRIKRIDNPPIFASDSWEDVRPRLEKCPEYRDLKNDELRRSAFEKHIRRLKEKEASAFAHDRSRHQDYDLHDPRRHHSPGYQDYHHSAEVDAYEADRKKAQANRERQYRKTSSSSSYNLPPIDTSRRREYRERDRHDGRQSGRLSAHKYENSYFDSDRAFRDSAARELDYGENGPAGSMNGTALTKRRDSEDQFDRPSSRASKRLKRDDGSAAPTKSSGAGPAQKTEETYRSGSEEGEIEED